MQQLEARLDLLAPVITEELKQLARDRVTLKRVPLVKEDDHLTVTQRAEAKVILILVKAMNPWEELYETEEALLRGISPDRLLKHKDEERRGHHSLFTKM